MSPLYSSYVNDSNIQDEDEESEKETKIPDSKDHKVKPPFSYVAMIGNVVNLVIFS